MTKSAMPIFSEDIALAISWAKDETRLKEIKKANGLEEGEKGMMVYVYLARALREAVRTGRLRESIAS